MLIIDAVTRRMPPNLPARRISSPPDTTRRGRCDAMNATRLTALLFLAIGARTIATADPPPAKPADEPVRAFLATHCASCHGGEKPKRDFRVDRLVGDFTDKANRERWTAVLGHLKDGTMPPDT